MFRLFRRADPEREAGRALFGVLARQARRPVFYTRLKVPDTIDGRFDLLALHGFMVMEALKGTGAAGERIGTHLATAIFESLEEGLRDLGVGDMGISRRIKAMADAYYGRLSAYSKARTQPAMSEALTRNLYRGDTRHGAEAALMADYVLQSLDRLREGDAETRLSTGTIAFAPLPD